MRALRHCSRDRHGHLAGSRRLSSHRLPQHGAIVRLSRHPADLHRRDCARRIPVAQAARRAWNLGDFAPALLAAQYARPDLAGILRVRRLAGRARCPRWQRCSLHAQVLYLQLLYTLSVPGDVDRSPRPDYFRKADPCCSVGERKLRHPLSRVAQVHDASVPGGARTCHSSQRQGAKRW